MAKDRQILFAEYYLELWNGTEAARRAGYKGNDNTLAATASRLLRNVSELTMDRAGKKLRHAEAELRAVIEDWDNMPDSLRYARVRQVQLYLANAITPAVNWRIMAQIDDVIVIRVRRLVDFLRGLGN